MDGWMTLWQMDIYMYVVSCQHWKWIHVSGKISYVASHVRSKFCHKYQFYWINHIFSHDWLRKWENVQIWADNNVKTVYHLTSSTDKACGKWGWGDNDIYECKCDENLKVKFDLNPQFMQVWWKSEGLVWPEFAVQVIQYNVVFFLLNNQYKSCGDLENWVKATKIYTAIKPIPVILYSKSDQNLSTGYKDN